MKPGKQAQILGGSGGMVAYDPVGAAIASGRSRSRIFLAIKNGELTARKDGKATLIEHDELVRWVRSMPTIGRQQTRAPEAESGQGNSAA